MQLRLVEMGERNLITGSYEFRGVDYIVSVNIEDEEKKLSVEVEDKGTADQWRGSFDAEYVEDLTHKTGNFKQFTIFVSMLESALVQSSDSVSLDLLTYTDLESLRNRKSGAPVKVAPARSSTLNTKRYLILTYTVEFDRIHYPLPLPYVGKPDPRALQQTIRELRQEVKTLKKHGGKDAHHKENEKLKKQIDALIQEKEDLEADFIDFKRQVQNTSKGSAAKEIRILKGIVKNLEAELVSDKTKYQRSSSKKSQEYRQLADEVEELRASERNLRVRVKSLTNELNLYKRDKVRPFSTSNRRSLSRDGSRSNSLVRDGMSSRENSFTRDSGKFSSRENSRLSQSSRDSRSTYTRPSRSSVLNAQPRDRSLSRDRSLTSRDKPVGRSASLTRGRSSSRDNRNSTLRNRSSSRESVGSARGIGERPFSHRQKPSAGYNSARDRPLRDRSTSRERLFREGSTSRERPVRDRSTSRERQFNVQRRAFSPSAAGARSPRFDPTAYIKEKDRKKKETVLKQRRQIRSRWTGGEDRLNQRPPSRNSSVGSFRSRSSSLESLSDIVADTDASEARYRKASGVLKQRKNSNSNGWSSPDVSYSKAEPPILKETKILASTPDNKSSKTQSRIARKENFQPTEEKGDYYDRTDEISEIDARLSRLQQFMKSNLS